MAVTVVLEHPRRHLFLRAWRQLLAFCGGTLLVAGLVSSAAVVPMTVVLGNALFGKKSVPGQTNSSDDIPWPDVGLGLTLFAWTASILLAIVGIRYGLRVLRGKRGLVLFLRRFGHDDATKAVTFAATRTVGGSWRLVALDDEAIAPIGIPAGTRRLYGFGRRTLELFPKVVVIFAKRVLPLTLAAMLAVVVIALFRAPDWHVALHDGTLDPYGDTLSSLLKAEIPVSAIAWSLPGVFSFFAILVALELAAVFFGSLAVGVLLIVVIPLIPVLMFVGFSAQAAEKAEAMTRLPIHVKKEIRPTAESVVTTSRNLFAPKLIVLRVASPVWQQTVKGFARVCSAPLIDLSDVSENVLWEIEEMIRTFGSKCLFVGRHDRVAWLADSVSTGLGPKEERLLRLLDGHEVLAYTTGRRGIRRFSRSLRAKLLTVSTLETPIYSWESRASPASPSSRHS